MPERHSRSSRSAIPLSKRSGIIRRAITPNDRLPVIGPSALWAHRRLTAGLVADHSGYQVDLALLSREIGLGVGTGRNSEFVRTLARLVDFHLAEIIDDRLGVYTSLPPLTRRQTDRLLDHLAQRHRTLASRRHDRSPYAARLSAEGQPDDRRSARRRSLLRSPRMARVSLPRTDRVRLFLPSA